MLSIFKLFIYQLGGHIVTGSAYDKWNISVVICDTDVRNGLSNHSGDRKTFEVMTST
jgi:hypothetical protein